MQRCQKCILPKSYPGILFDEHGVCNFCNNPRKIKYEGQVKLKRKIISYKSKNKVSEYDCAIGFSGGRDSSYLLYYLTKILKLKVIALTIDNGHIPNETKGNIKKITELLKVDLVYKRHSYLTNTIRHNLRSWIHKPSAAMIGLLCTGCRLGLSKSIYELLREYRVPVYITGGTPFEGNQFKTDLLRMNPDNPTNHSLICGYTKNILHNFKWISKLYAAKIQFYEYRSRYLKHYKKKIKELGCLEIAPFYRYIRWDERQIVYTLENDLGWIKNKETGSTWRGDCEIAQLKLFLYKKMLDFNDKDDALSDLIRDGQISRKEALDRLEAEQYISDNLIKSLLKKYGICYTNFIRSIENSSNPFQTVNRTL